MQEAGRRTLSLVSTPTYSPRGAWHTLVLFQDETDLLGDGQREYTIQGFYQWILSDPGRRQTAIRRVDLIKSNEIHHAFHEALLFHVHGPLGEFSGEEIQIYSAWRIIMERAGNLPPNIMVIGSPGSSKGRY